MTDMSNDLLNRVCYVLIEAGVEDVDLLRPRLQIVIGNYSVSAKTEALQVWTEGKNSNWINRFLMAKAVAGCTARTIQAYDRNLRRVFRELGRDADTLTATDIQVYLAQIISRSSTTNADNFRRTLSSFYGWMHREELIPTNPMNRVDAIRLRKKQKHALTDIDVEKIRLACRSTREKAMIEVLLSTGCRVSELVGIRLDDIDGKAVSIIGKGEKPRTVYLNAKAQIAIQIYLAERSDVNPWLFPRMNDVCRTGEVIKKMRGMGPDWYRNREYVDEVRHMEKSSVEGIVRNIGKRAGVDHVHPHRFRRTCATSALRRGMPIEQVSRMLGHEQLSTTQIYLDIGERSLEIAHEKYVT